MRQKAEIERLTKEAPTIEFPKATPWTEADGRRSHFGERLRRVLAENFKLDTRTISYCESSGVYQWDIAPAQIWFHEGGVTLKLIERYEIDPRKNIAEEIARVEAERERNRAIRRSIAQHATQLGGEQ